jgi:hypothetical protein
MRAAERVPRCCRPFLAAPAGGPAWSLLASGRTGPPLGPAPARSPCSRPQNRLPPTAQKSPPSNRRLQSGAAPQARREEPDQAALAPGAAEPRPAAARPLPPGTRRSPIPWCGARPPVLSIEAPVQAEADSHPSPDGIANGRMADSRMRARIRLRAEASRSHTRCWIRSRQQSVSRANAGAGRRAQPQDSIRAGSGQPGAIHSD